MKLEKTPTVLASALAVLMISAVACQERPDAAEPPSQSEGVLMPAAAVVMAARADCTCYYTYHKECPVGFACTGSYSNWGCKRQTPKGGSLGGGCTTDLTGLTPCTTTADCFNSTVYKCVDGFCEPKVSGCDGQCEPRGNGSVCGIEAVPALAKSVQSWSDVYIGTSRVGGRPLDHPSFQQVSDSSLAAECTFYISRAMLGILELCAGERTVMHPATSHASEEHVIENLSADACRTDAASTCFAAVLAGVEHPTHAVAPIVVPSSCGGGMPVSAACQGARDYMGCVRDRIEDLVVNMTTAR